MKTYNLFISHSWAYGSNYDSLVNLLKNKSYFCFNDYSVPKNDPIHNANNDSQLKTAIKNKMQPCHVILILAGVYATYSKWINIEIDLAKRGFSYKKPIIAIEPWGSEKTSTTVKNNADRIVAWNTDSIVNAIRELV